MPAGTGNLLVAGEGIVYDGPWDVPDRMHKLNGVVRYSQGTALDGFSITGMAYNNRWTSTDQVAKRAIDQGLIGRFGTLDPTDGGRSSRYSLSTRFSMLNDWGVTKMEAYAIRYTMTLFNNFTYFLDDPVNGDQFSQTDSRTIYGFHGNHTFKGRLGPFDSETRIGVQSRYDDIDVGPAQDRAARRRSRPCAPTTCRKAAIALYAQNTTHWTPWLRTIVGVRGDWYRAKVDERQSAQLRQRQRLHRQPEVQPDLRTVLQDRALLQRRLRLPLQRRARRHHHRRSRHRPARRQGAVPGALQGRRGRRAQRRSSPGSKSSVALFVLDYASELLFVGDAGTTEASRPSRRVGVEWTNHYKPVPWLAFDLDLAMTRARFTDFDPAGDHIPGAPNMVVDRRRDRSATRPAGSAPRRCATSGRAR